MTTIIYARVSTKCQSTERQVEELKAVAEKAGWDVVDVKIDHGISGSKGTAGRAAAGRNAAVARGSADGGGEWWWWRRRGGG